MNQITLKCCTCDEIKDIIVQRKPEFGFEFYGMISKSGWYPVLDLNYSRTLCFCSEECYKKQLTKSGLVRKRLLHIPKEN